MLITTPESLHVLLAKGSDKRFGGLTAVVVDEWHDLLEASAASRWSWPSPSWALAPVMKVWGISATIGNLEEAMETLVGMDRVGRARIIRSDIEKRISVDSLMPEAFEKLAWAGHLGVQLLDQVVGIIRQHSSTLVFTNTRAQSEIWYQKILAAHPDLAGAIAAMGASARSCDSGWKTPLRGQTQGGGLHKLSDLGVDFRPVEAIVQIGGPKGVARFVRAGRSGHQPGAEARSTFCPRSG